MAGPNPRGMKPMTTSRQLPHRAKRLVKDNRFIATCTPCLDHLTGQPIVLVCNYRAALQAYDIQQSFICMRLSDAIAWLYPWHVATRNA